MAQGTALGRLAVRSGTWLRSGGVQTEYGCLRHISSQQQKAPGQNRDNSGSSGAPRPPGASGAEEPLPDPPSAVETVAAMASGAAGAVAIAAVGVWGVFEMALWVAGSAGKRLKPEGSGEKT